MKIRIDASEIFSLNSNIPGRKTGQPLSSKTAPEAVKSDAHIRSVINRLSQEKSLRDALSITQMSQNLIHKAIMISSKLRGIASEAISTGRIDANEVSAIISDMNSSIKFFGESIAGPAQSVGVIRSEINGLDKDLGAVRDGAVNLAGGYPPDEKALGITMGSLNERISVLNQREESIKRDLIDLYSQESAEQAAPKNILKSVISGIEARPSEAMSLQGNISPDNARRRLSA
jgi:hypothetical protein